MPMGARVDTTPLYLVCPGQLVVSLDLALPARLPVVVVDDGACDEELIVDEPAHRLHRPLVDVAVCKSMQERTAMRERHRERERAR